MSSGASARAAASPSQSVAEWFESRALLRRDFLDRHGWGEAQISPVGEDCAFRRYVRLKRGDETVLLMEAVPDGETIATPGHSLHDFVRIGAYLRSIGLHTPQIYEADEKNGYLLLEDFGDVSFKAALAGGADKKELYGLAVDVLAHLRAHADAIELPDYYASHVHTGRRRIVDWYIPALRGAGNPDGLAEEYLAVWDGIEKSLPPCPRGFMHIDYHVENLMWLPHAHQLTRCGLLDFQGAMVGPLPYDLANLLEDARADVPPEVRSAMRARYCVGMNPFEKENFENWYRILATQFHCRVAGQFIRLALKDGKTRYLAHLPRVQGYLREGLEHPVLKPLKSWFSAQKVDFSTVPDIGVKPVTCHIRPDAF